MHTAVWRGNMKERDHFQEVDIDGEIILKWILKKYDGTA
jgi:hypothetical protein